MLLSSKKSSDPEEEQIFPARRDVLTSFHVMVFLVSVAIGSGVIKLGTAYQAGALLSPILSGIIAILSCYSFTLFLKAACWAKAATFEEIWMRAFGPKTVPICASISVVSMTVVLESYVSFVYDSVKSLILEFYPEAPWYLTDKYILLSAVFVVFLIPMFCSKSLKVIAVMSYVKVLCLAFLCFVFIYRFAETTMKQGFDPNNQIAYFRFDSRAVTLLNTLLTAYLMLPMCYPGIQQVSKFTVKSFMRSIKITMTVCWIVYNICGEICYFTAWDQQETMLDFYPDDVLNLISRFALTLMTIYSCHVAVNPIRYVLINLIAKLGEFSTAVWASVGIGVTYIAIVLTSLTGDVKFYISVVTNIQPSFMLFIFPAMLYLKAFGTHSKLHLVGSIGILLLGLAAIGFSLWQMIISK